MRFKFTQPTGQILVSNVKPIKGVKAWIPRGTFKQVASGNRYTNLKEWGNSLQAQ